MAMSYAPSVHSSEAIGDLLEVATGRKIGRLFLSQLDVPVIVFQEVGEEFDDAAIVATQNLLSAEYGEPYVHDGILYPEVALERALLMVRENAAASARNN